MRCGETSAPTIRRSNGSEEAHVTVLKPWKSQNYLTVDFYIVKKNAWTESATYLKLELYLNLICSSTAMQVKNLYFLFGVLTPQLL